MPINPLKGHLRKASRVGVKEAIKLLRSHLKSKRWIGLGNIYAKSYRARPYKDVVTRRPLLRKKQIRDYVAASIFNHCSDGWSLMGRALSLLIKGDSNSAIHLAYYAELRAAMSLLAAEGVGVFNNRHVIISEADVDLTPDLYRIRGLPYEQKGLSRTHRFVWMALEHWADRKLSAELLAKIISPGSISLSDWFDAFGVGGNLHPIGSSWLKSWGIDIKQFGDDQVLRNHSSYRPSRIIPKKSTSAPDSLAFLCELWRMCEPNPSSRFDEIDRHLLRTSLKQAYQAVLGLDPCLSTNSAGYRTWVKKNISSLGLTTSIQASWIDFLTWRIQPNESRIIKEASKLTFIDDPDYHLQVLSRTILLLRIATGISGDLLREVGYSRSDLEFWCLPYAVDHGLIQNRIPVSDFLDLWADIDTALQDIIAWETSHVPNYSYYDLANDVSRPIFRLSECERILLWGLGI